MIYQKFEAKAARRSSVLREGGLQAVSGFHYVYILQSLSHPNQIYTGMTANLKQRLVEHNSRGVPHTSKFVPWKIRSAAAFNDKVRAIAFERYLKSGSGRAFLHRHL